MGWEGKDKYSLTVEAGETLKFCSAGCLETDQQEVASAGGWRDELLSWGGWYKSEISTVRSGL